MLSKIHRGAEIVIKQWLQLTKGERLLIITSDEFKKETELLLSYAREEKAHVDTMIFEKTKHHVSQYFDEHETAFDSYDVILGATSHSLVTTKAVKRAIMRGSRYLSLPLATNNNQSLLEFDFLLMNPKESEAMAYHLLEQLKDTKELMVTTKAGTNLTFSMEQRNAQLFTGDTKIGTGYASSSFEIFIPVVENQTKGVGIVDASFGYLGVPKQSVKIELHDGKIIAIEQNESGRILSEYMKNFNDERMYYAGEFGIGLNKFSKCCGNSYIEDESAYHTFHIGFGRNIAFGGMLEASAHFDLVFDRPNIYADGVLIMNEGEIV